ncbi:MAG TPA: Flp pilus assembly complex ATPase component TadA [Candidatus Hydrogenedentes bacterium]|nr:Flp pilus assembly complex ATPase component TadA [Candidatus Hydrogenedentota bacterium]
MSDEVIIFWSDEDDAFVSEARVIRVGGSLGLLERTEAEPLTADAIEQTARAAIGKEDMARIGPESGKFQRWCGSPGEYGASICVARTHGEYSIVMRVIKMSRIPSVAEVYLPEPMIKASESPSGLIVFAGRVGSGKTTGLYSLVDHINANRACHICTLEESFHLFISPKKALVQQREVGVDVPSFLAGIEAAMNQDLDVLLVGEITNVEELQASITVAETGHLVLTQLHPPASPETAIQRMMDVFSRRCARGRAQRACSVVARGLRADPSASRGRRRPRGRVRGAHPRRRNAPSYRRRPRFHEPQIADARGLPDHRRRRRAPAQRGHHHRRKGLGRPIDATEMPLSASGQGDTTSSRASHPGKNWLDRVSPSPPISPFLRLGTRLVEFRWKQVPESVAADGMGVSARPSSISAGTFAQFNYVESAALLARRGHDHDQPFCTMGCSIINGFGVSCDEYLGSTRKISGGNGRRKPRAIRCACTRGRGTDGRYRRCRRWLAAGAHDVAARRTRPTGRVGDTI